MTNLLAVSALTGLAIAFNLETADQLLNRWFTRSELKKIIPLIFAAVYNWLLGIHDWSLVVSIPASVTAGLLIIQWSERPSVSLKMPGRGVL